MAKKPVKKDNFATYTVVTVLLILVTGFIVAWFYRGSFSKMSADVAYVEFAPMVVETEGYTIAAHLAVQTSPDDADWAQQHKHNLLTALQGTLSGSDPKKMMTPDDLRTLQSSMKEAGNQALHTEKVQAVLLTDFVIKAD